MQRHKLVNVDQCSAVKKKERLISAYPLSKHNRQLAFGNVMLVGLLCCAVCMLMLCNI